MKNKFNVDKIVAYLEPLRDRLPELYSWEISDDNLNELKSLQVDWSEEEKEKIEYLKGANSYEKAIALKSLIASRYKSGKLTARARAELGLWIIKDWGRITSGVENNTLSLIRQVKQPYELLFDRVASSSKIASFMSPGECIIYDSRVVYSLNWIILSVDALNTGGKFFPVPSLRNPKLKAFDINVLIRLKYIENYRLKKEAQENKRLISNQDKRLYFQKNKSYTKLNQLIKSIHEKLWAHEPEKIKKLYYTEMLLFSIADKEIYDDITSRPWSESSNQ